MTPHSQTGPRGCETGISYIEIAGLEVDWRNPQSPRSMDDIATYRPLAALAPQAYIQSVSMDLIDMVSSRRSILFLCLLLLVMADAADLKYRSATVDARGRLRIELESGSVLNAPTLKYQVGFEAPAISPDQRTVGWFVDYDPPEAWMNPIAGALVLYRSGRIFRSFKLEPVAWDWQFQDGGKRVAYSMGPLHGDATECVLRDVDSGEVVARWLATDGNAPPGWARNLRGV
jgi:hypothetical protein